MEIIVSACAVFISIIVAITQYIQTRDNHKEAKTLAQHQAFIALQEKIVLSSIDYDKPWTHIPSNINSLELIAIAWKYSFVDKDILRKLYKRSFIEIFDQIKAVDDPVKVAPPRNLDPDFELSATQFLSTFAPTACSLYSDFKTER